MKLIAKIQGWFDRNWKSIPMYIAGITGSIIFGSLAGWYPIPFGIDRETTKIVGILAFTFMVLSKPDAFSSPGKFYIDKIFERNKKSDE
ncbi:MAG: hypothetical protein AAFO78_13745 [Pseudomonadota bacterium]